jgi:hypothetical protein
MGDLLEEEQLVLSLPIFEELHVDEGVSFDVDISLRTLALVSSTA